MLRAVLVTVAIGIFGLCQGSLGSKPTIFPQSEYVINEGEELIIQCESDKNVTFAYPNYDYAATSEVEIIRENNTLLRRQSVYGDTGWYACAEVGVNIPYDIDDPDFITEHNQPDIAWTYVYVKSEDHKFIREKAFQQERPTAGLTFIIDCRATSPYLHVNLYNEDEKIVTNDRISYDHRVGFIWSKVTVEDSGYYECGADGMGDRINYSFYINVKTQRTLPTPVIVGERKQYIRRGETLRMNCTLDAQAGETFDFRWRRRSHEGNTRTDLKIGHDQKHVGQHVMQYICQLVLENVKDTDEGEYECYVNDDGKIKYESVFVEVLKPHTNHINLTVHDNKLHYELHHGGNVSLVVNVDAFPKPELTWYKIGNPCEKIYEGRIHDHRFVKPQTLQSQTVMEIRALKFDDTGVYQVKAVKDEEIHYLNISVNVIGKPIVGIDEVQNTFPPDKFAKFVCQVEANPKPDLKWVYEKCFDYPTCKDQLSYTIKKSNNIWKSDIHLVSEVNVMIDTFGTIRCIANNSHGQKEYNSNISVSEVKDFFGIIETQETFTEGDDVALTCAASLFNYSTTPEWSRSGGGKLDDGIEVDFRKTKFTNQSILRIRNVRKSHGGEYNCSVLDIYDRLEFATHELRIIDPAAPTIKEPESQINVHKGGNLTVPCTVYGTPPPTVTWYKDDKPLIDKTFSFNDQGQKLIKSVVLEEHEGRYCCVAKNRVGNARKCVDIVVAGKTGVPVYWFGIIGVFTVIVVILISYLCYKVNRERKLKRELMEAGLTHFEEGAMECLNPDLTVDDQAELLPYDKKWEFPRDRLKLGKQLGSGAFGVVMKAEAHGICDEETTTTVAVKMVRRTAEPTYIRALASELKIMVHLGKHLNVVNLLGACTKNISKRELLVIVEYCRFGNLHNYLQRHRTDFINQIDPATDKIDPAIGLELLMRTTSVSSSNKIKYAALSFSRSISINSAGSSSANEAVEYRPGPDSEGVVMSPDGCVLSNNTVQPGWRSNYRGDYKDKNLKPICTQDLLCWAFQVARGMEYLSFRKVLHGDLAARNILLAENNVVKICDFGLAKTMYKDNNYKKKGEGLLPIKWMAIESIRDGVFSTQSDVWSFGIVLWEFFTLAETPYPGLAAEKQYQKLIEGHRMEKPEFATKEIYDIMLHCWKAKQTLRPSFTDLAENIGGLLEDSVKNHYVDLNTPYLDMNTITLENGKSDYLMMMSAPDHTALSSPGPEPGHEYVNSPCVTSETGKDAVYLCMSPNSQVDDTVIFSPRHETENTRFNFPTPASPVFSDSDDAVEISPMLSEQDPYEKPINVQQRRAEFAQKQQHQKDIDKATERDSGYPRSPMHLIDLNGAPDDKKRESNMLSPKGNAKEYTPTIINTNDNYVNMPQQKIDRCKETGNFSNPSYMLMNSAQDNNRFV